LSGDNLINYAITFTLYGFQLLQDDDDNASQVTTDSQESQDDLIELGLANEDYKPKVVQRFMKNISNPQVTAKF